MEQSRNSSVSVQKEAIGYLRRIHQTFTAFSHQIQKP